MTPVNIEVVTRLLAEMEQAVVKLRSLSSLSQNEFLSDSNYYDSAKYNLIVAVETIIDLCNHIIAQEKLGKPEDYSDVLRIVGARLSLSADFIMRLEKMAKFRNLIVHLYWKKVFCFEAGATGVKIKTSTRLDPIASLHITTSVMPECFYRTSSVLRYGLKHKDSGFPLKDCGNGNMKKQRPSREVINTLIGNNLL